MTQEIKNWHPVKFVFSRLRYSHKRHFFQALIIFFIFIVPSFWMITRPPLFTPIIQEEIPQNYFLSTAETLFSDDFESGSLDRTKWQTVINKGGGNTYNIVQSNLPGNSSKVLHTTNKVSTDITFIHEFTTDQQGTVTAEFYDDLNTTNNGTFIAISDGNWPQTTPAQIVAVGIYPGNFKTTYWYRSGSSVNTNNINTNIPRTKGWHKVELVSTPKGSYAKLDGINLSYLPKAKAAGASIATLNPVAVGMKSFKKIGLVTAWNPTHQNYFDNVVKTNLETLPTQAIDRELRFAQMFADERLENYNYTGSGTVPDFDRLRANQALVYAILAYTDPTKVGYWNKVESLLNIIYTDNIIKPLPKLGEPLESYTIGLTLWLAQDKYLSENLRNNLRLLLISEGDHWASKNPLNLDYKCQTAAESNAWTSGFLALMSQMYTAEPNHSYWEEKAKLWANHTFTSCPGGSNTKVTCKSSDPFKIFTAKTCQSGATGETIGGVKTLTLYPDYKMGNHGYYPNPSYTLVSIQGLAKAALAYKLAGNNIAKLNSDGSCNSVSGNVPCEFTHNVFKVWNAVQPYLDYNSYLHTNCQIANKFAGKDDWGSDMTQANPDIAYMSILLDKPNLIKDLTEYEFYIEDFNAYPIKTLNGTPTKEKIWWDTAAEPLIQQYSGQYFLNSINAKRHVLSYLMQSNIKLNPLGFTQPNQNPTNTPTPTITPTPGISAINLKVFDLTKWSIVQNLQIGNSQYSDRGYLFTTSLPAELKGVDWIKTANGSKSSTQNPLATFTITKNAYVYIAFDKRITTKPTWLASDGWVDTGIDFTNSEPITFRLYKKYVAAGTEVILRPLPTSPTNKAMYTVFVK